MTRLLGLNVLPKQRGFLYLCITTGFSRSLAVTFTAKATVIRSFVGCVTFFINQNRLFRL